MHTRATKIPKVNRIGATGDDRGSATLSSAQGQEKQVGKQKQYEDTMGIEGKGQVQYNWDFRLQWL